MVVLSITQRHNPWELVTVGVASTNDVVVTNDIGFESRHKENTGQQAEHNFETAHITAYAITEFVDSCLKSLYFGIIWYFIKMMGWNIERYLALSIGDFMFVIIWLHKTLMIEAMSRLFTAIREIAAASNIKTYVNNIVIHEY